MVRGPGRPDAFCFTFVARSCVYIRVTRADSAGTVLAARRNSAATLSAPFTVTLMMSLPWNTCASFFGDDDAHRFERPVGDVPDDELFADQVRVDLRVDALTDRAGSEVGR